MIGVFDVDRSRAGWWVVGVLLGAAMLFVLYSFVGTFVFGVFIYYATRPIYRRVRRQVGQPSLAAAGSLLLLMLPVVLLLWYAVAIGLQEFTNVVEQIDPGLRETVFEQQYLDLSQIILDPAELLTNTDGLATLTNAINSATDFAGVLGTGALHLFVMFALAFYMLRDDQRLSRWFHARFDDERGVVAAYVRAVDRDFTNIFFGNILNAILTGTIGAVAYSLLGLVAPAPVNLPYAALVGLLAGAASLVPVVGMKLVYVPMTGYLVVQSVLAGTSETLWFPVAFAAVSFVVVDAIPDLVLRPYVSGGQLHLGMVMFAYIFGPLLFGWYGIFLGPMLLVSVVHFARIVLPELLEGHPIQPYSVDPEHLTGEGELPAVARDPPPRAPPPTSSSGASGESTPSGRTGSEAPSDAGPPAGGGAASGDGADGPPRPADEPGARAAGDGDAGGGSD